MDKGKQTLLALVDRTESSKLSVKHANVAKSPLKAKTYTTLGSNNWMNIRSSKAQNWLGQMSALGGFVIFEKPEYSVRAFYKILNSYKNQGKKTVSAIANTYAPKGDNNNPSAYVNAFKKALEAEDIKFDVSKEIPVTLYPLLAKVFLKIESGLDKDLNWLTTVYNTYL